MAVSESRPAVPAVLYDVDEAAEALRLSRSVLYELIRSGRATDCEAGPPAIGAGVGASRVRRLAGRSGVTRDRARKIAVKPVADRRGGRIELSVKGPPNDRRAAVHAANKRRNRMTPETLRRVAEIAQAHSKGQGARSGVVVSDDAYRAIEDARDVSPQTAQRWVKRAREAGGLL